MLVTTFKSHTEQVCRETFLDGNGDISSLLECVTVTKGQMMEILETRIESWWKDTKEGPEGPKPLLVPLT